MDLAVDETRARILGTGPTPEQIYTIIEQQQVEFVSLQFIDILGMVKNVTVPARIFPGIVERGQWIDGSSISGFSRIEESDMFLVPDLSTFDILVSAEHGFVTARVICWVHSPDGAPFPGDARNLLLGQLEKLAQLGYTYQTGPELEFFLFERDGKGKVDALPHDRGSYFDLNSDLADTVRKDMVRELLRMGIEVEASHHESAIGQHEIDFEYGPAIPTADRAITFKYILKSIAQRYGLLATFMPKPVEGMNGSGMHVHQSLGFLDTERGTNAFVDTDDPYGLSKIARHFIAGQLKHASGLAAVVAPLVNSYRRLVPGYEAPVYVAWARTNRSALIRVPAIQQGNTNATRVELRCPDPSCNPYLAMTAMLAAGMDGIINELPLENPIEENLYKFTPEDLSRRNIPTLPATLGDAIEAFRNDHVIREALGAHVSQRLIELQTAEWDAFRTHVTGWERDRYLQQY